MPTQRKPDTLAEVAYQRMRSIILRGELPLGSPVLRRKLAGQFGMSLVPVAAALQRLEAEGLVESRPRSGTRVRIPTPQEIRGHYIVREALESQAARLFAEMATMRKRAELMKMAKQVDAMYTSSPLVRLDRAKRLYEIHEQHLLFHVRIAQSTGCRELISAIGKNQILIFQWLYNSAAHFDTLPPRWHQDLVEALASGDPEKADQAMRLHVRFRRDEVAERIRAYLVANDSARTGFRGTRAAE